MISNPESLVDGYLSRWLLDEYSTANTLLQDTSLKDRKILKKTDKKLRACHGLMTHPQFYKANYFFPLSASSGIGQFSDGVRISFITLSKPITISGYFLARLCFSSGSSRRL